MPKELLGGLWKSRIRAERSVFRTEGRYRGGLWYDQMGMAEFTEAAAPRLASW